MFKGEGTSSSVLQQESIASRLEKSASAIESLKNLRESNKISEEEFVNLLEKEKVKVDKLLTAMVSDPGTVLHRIF